MTKMQEIMGRILTNRITRDKANNTLNIEEITNMLKIFLAGDDITFEQYTGFIDVITPVANTTTVTQ